MSESQAADVFREASASIPVGQPPVEAVVAAARARRRRTRATVVWVAAASAGFVALTSWLASRPSAEQPEPFTARLVSTENPLDVAWYANGVLHLPHVALEVPSLGSLVEVGVGAVYADRRGAVVLVGPDGALTRIGRAHPGAPLAAGGALVAWVDPGERAPELVVYDVDRGHTIGRRELPYEGPRWDPAEEASHPIAVDRETVYYAAQDGDHTWELPDGPAGFLLPPQLLDVAAGHRVLGVDDDTIRMVQPLFNITLDRPGSSRAQLSPEGNYALTRTFPGGPTANPFGSVRIYDTRSGDRLATGLGAGDVAVAATLGPDATATYIVARAADAPRGEMYLRLSFVGPLELRSCQLEYPLGQGLPEETRCRNLGQVPRTGAAPLLAG